MTAALVLLSTRSLFLLTVCTVIAAPAQALPIKNPDNCQGPVTIGVATCPDKPGHWVECLPGGEYMCCVGNSQGGKDCEQIEDTVPGKAGGKMGGMRAPLGNMQMSPATTPPPPTTRVPKSGVMNAPVMRRGVEGDQGTEPAPEPDGDKGKAMEQQGK